MMKLRVDWNGTRVRVADNSVQYNPTFDAHLLTVPTERMLQLGQFAVDLIKARLARFTDSGDGPMPPLTPRMYKNKSTGETRRVNGYPEFKVRLGLVPMRDLRGPGGRTVTVVNPRNDKRKTVTQRSGTGHMLDDLRVLAATNAYVQYGIATFGSRVKARRNEIAIQKRGGSGWFGLSATDCVKMRLAMQQVFGEVFDRFTQNFRGFQKTWTGWQGIQGRPKWMDPAGMQRPGARSNAA